MERGLLRTMLGKRQMKKESEKQARAKQDTKRS